MSVVTSNEHAPLLAAYNAGRAYDELLQAGREPRSHYRALYDRLLSLPADELNRRKSAADVPPTKGVFQGLATSELSVSVRVSPDPIPINLDEQGLLPAIAALPPKPAKRIDWLLEQQQQQQQ